MKQKDVRKIDIMHRHFGTSNHICGECSNLVCGRYHDRILRKCEVYGLTHSEASDWAKRWEACGMFNKEYTGRPIIETVKKGQKVSEQPINGQSSLFVDGG